MDFYLEWMNTNHAKHVLRPGSEKK
jgi:hypothetical protein